MIKPANYFFTADSNHTMVGKSAVLLGGKLLAHIDNDFTITLRTARGLFTLVDGGFVEVTEASPEAAKTFAFVDRYVSK